MHYVYIHTHMCVCVLRVYVKGFEKMRDSVKSSKALCWVIRTLPSVYNCAWLSLLIMLYILNLSWKLYTRKRAELWPDQDHAKKKTWKGKWTFQEINWRGARAKKQSGRVGSSESQSPVLGVSTEKATNTFLIQCTLGEYAVLVQRESHLHLRFSPLLFSCHIKNTSKSG